MSANEGLTSGAGQCGGPEGFKDGLPTRCRVPARVVDLEAPLVDYLPAVRGYVQTLCMTIESQHDLDSPGEYPEVAVVLERVRGFASIRQWHELRKALVDFYGDYVLGDRTEPPAGPLKAPSRRSSCEDMLAQIMVVRAHQSFLGFVDAIVDEFPGHG